MSSVINNSKGYCLVCRICSSRSAHRAVSISYLACTQRVYFAMSEHWIIKLTIRIASLGSQKSKIPEMQYIVIYISSVDR